MDLNQNNMRMAAYSVNCEWPDRFMTIKQLLNRISLLK